MTESEIIDYANKFLKNCRDQGFKIPDRVEIVLNDKKVRWAGMCSYDRHTGWYTLTFNMFFAKMDGQAFGQTIVHEICHIIDHLRNGRFSHGRYWKLLMRSFGCDDAATQKRDLEELGLMKRKQRQFEYKCACRSDIIVSTIRHNKMQSGKQKYRCRRCFTFVDFVREVV